MHKEQRREQSRRSFLSPLRFLLRFQGFSLELLGGFEPPTSSLPSDKMPSSRCGIRVCGRFCPKKEEVGNSLLHVFRPLVSPCGSRCGSEPPASSVWVNFLWQWNGHILRCWKPAKKSSPNSKKSYRQKKSIAKQRRQSGSLGRLK